VAVLDPLKLILDNYPEGQSEECSAPVHPKQPEMGRRVFPLSRELWIEREDFNENPPKGYFRLFPGNKVRLRYGYVIECTGVDKDADGNVIAVHATTCRKPRAARLARTASRSRATSTGSARRTRVKPKSACTTVCSTTRTRMPAARTSSTR
jgi:glutamyl/glutaminyl-tRNA synthetase